jgi:hypothetical protein
MTVRSFRPFLLGESFCHQVFQQRMRLRFQDWGDCSTDPAHDLGGLLPIGFGVDLRGERGTKWGLNGDDLRPYCPVFGSGWSVE